jgi:hypothetical protein
MPDSLIDPVKVKAEMTAMVDLISHPAFVGAMKNLKALPAGERQEYGKKNLTVAALEQKGVRFPAGMRLTTRYFENGKAGFVEWRPDGSSAVTKAAEMPIASHGKGTVQWGGCACGGGMTFCGGAGGGT